MVRKSGKGQQTMEISGHRNKKGNTQDGENSQNLTINCWLKLLFKSVYEKWVPGEFNNQVKGKGSWLYQRSTSISDHDTGTEANK